jgi:N-succinyldiaminopimelate aminotransferase
MPRPPALAHDVTAMPAAVYDPLAAEAARGPALPVPLNVGDTWREPFPGGRMEDLRTAEHPGLHRYGPPRGQPALLEALLERVRGRSGVAFEPESLLVTGGATSGLHCAVAALADPGEEVLILAPFWPLIRGIVQANRVRPVEVPFYDRVASAAEAVAAVEARLSQRSVALYVCTPSNPTGRVLPAGWLEALAALARREDLWLLSDEVYEDYVYRGEHVSLARFAPERTVCAWSFSKSYGVAGNRVGYLAGPPAVVAEALKVSTHTVYHAPSASQRAALRALEGGAAWLAESREAYRAAGEDAARVLGLPLPEGSTFLFLDVARRLDERGLLGFLRDCLAAGVLVAPGSSCGADYAGWIRLCYTAAPPDEVARAVRRIAALL